MARLSPLLNHSKFSYVNACLKLGLSILKILVCGIGLDFTDQITYAPHDVSSKYACSLALLDKPLWQVGFTCLHSMYGKRDAKPECTKTKYMKCGKCVLL